MTSTGHHIETIASEIERKQRNGTATDPTYSPPHTRRPRLKKSISCEFCGCTLWVGKHPKPFKCPTCRHFFFPCDRCDDNCSKVNCRHDDGEYYEEGIWVRTR